MENGAVTTARITRAPTVREKEAVLADNFGSRFHLTISNIRAIPMATLASGNGTESGHQFPDPSNGNHQEGRVGHHQSAQIQTFRTTTPFSSGLSHKLNGCTAPFPGWIPPSMQPALTLPRRPAR